MTAAEIFNKLSAALPNCGLVLEEGPKDTIIIPRDALRETAQLLRDDPDLKFDALMCLSAVDMAQELQVVYHLCSMTARHRVTLRCAVSKEDPVVPTLCPVWPAANWHEREAFDLLGVRFDGHPDFRRILCPDDWEGHPLRKDYVMPTSYQDIPLTAELPPESKP